MDPAWNVHARQLDVAVRQATRELLNIVRTHPAISRDDLLFYYQALVEKYGLATTQSAVLALENSRKTLNLWEVLAPPSPADLPPAAQIEGTFSWAARKADDDPKAVARLLAGPLGRLIRQPARDTIWNSTADAGTRYARVPGPTACAFCLMLASRGAVYTSKEAALTVSKRSAQAPQLHYRNKAAKSGHTFMRGRPEGASFHDNCTCTAVESHSDADLPEFIHQLQDEWYEATWKDGAPVQNQAEKWRNYIAETRPNGETIKPT